MFLRKKPQRGIGFMGQPLSQRNRFYLGLLLLAVVVTLVFLAVKGGGAYSVAAWIIGLPLFLVILSLFLGQASKGRGIFSATSLYFFAAVVFGSSTLAGWDGYRHYWAGIIMAAAILAIAKSRDNDIS